MQSSVHTNALIHASSPYLLQHAHNPVNWQEWSEAAFEQAKTENKLVIISIGYSACHWCHVMERETFEQEDTAEIMNNHFVCIKVDREERPDIDKIYMDAVQLLTGSGGWPLHCFTLADGRPIHGGTYFTKKNWEQTLLALADLNENHPQEAVQYAEDLTAGIVKLNTISKIIEGQNEINLFESINKYLAQTDQTLGGYLWAPKFPMPNNWELLLNQYYYTNDVQLLHIVDTTLTAMANGGIYDQLRGGFCRYSTDSFWKAPHFEKMLYDNAQLVSLYTKAFQQTKNPLYVQVVKQTLGYIAAEQTAPEGYFYSALDADSEGEEGKFYVWTKQELQEVLGTDEPLFSLYYNIDAYGNWEHLNNILYKTADDNELEKLTGKSIIEIDAIINNCKSKLLIARNKRVKPGLDDKMITSWNAMMIKAYAEAFSIFDEVSYLNSATKAADFIMTKMFVNQQLFRIHRNGKTSLLCFADDYALVIEAMIKLFEVTGDIKYANWAKQLTDKVIADFYNADINLFNYSSNQAETLITVKVEINDDVIPSSNSVLAKNLIILGYFFSNNYYHHIADEMLFQMQHKVTSSPISYSNWLQVYQIKKYGLNQIVCSGKQTYIMARAINDYFIPNKIVLRHEESSSIPLLSDKTVTGNNKYYVCHNKTCGLPSNSLSEVLDALKIT